jgi:hypothetical protein
MGYQEYLVTVRNERDFNELARRCAEAREAGFYYSKAVSLEPRSVVVFKQNIGSIRAGTRALWVTGARTPNPGEALLPRGAPVPRARFLPADNAEALGMTGEYARGIDFSDESDKSSNEYMTRYSLSAYCTEFCIPQTAFADTLRGREFMRRLNAAGFRCAFDDDGTGMVCFTRRGNVTLDANGDIRCKPEYRSLAITVRDIRDEVDEYMTAFENAAPGVERFPGGGQEDTRTLLMYAGHELAARSLSDGSMDFVTWRLDRNGEREIGHYHDGYAAAKEDFAARCGLINRRKLFTETELRVIRSGLTELGYIAPDRGFDEMTAIRSAAEKIDELVIPELAEREQDAEDQCYEPEMDL